MKKIFFLLLRALNWLIGIRNHIIRGGPAYLEICLLPYIHVPQSHVKKTLGDDPRYRENIRYSITPFFQRLLTMGNCIGVSLQYGHGTRGLRQRRLIVIHRARHTSVYRISSANVILYGRSMKYIYSFDGWKRIWRNLSPHSNFIYGKHWDRWIKNGGTFQSYIHWFEKGSIVVNCIHDARTIIRTIWTPVVSWWEVPLAHPHLRVGYYLHLGWYAYFGIFSQTIT